MIGQVLNQRYRLTDVLGQGGMGQVFLAEDQTLGRRVAVKLLTPDYSGTTALDRLRQEARLQASLEHPRIVRLYDVGRDRQTYLVLEYVEGADLGDLLKRFSLPQVMVVLADVLAGLEEAHRRGMIHRDLKPQNVLVSLRGDAKICDFGVGRIIDEEAARLTRIGSTVGSAQYMAPEQASGQPLDGRADLYSVGIILYQAATKRLPFDGTQLEILHQQVHATPTPPRHINSSVPVVLSRFILRLLDKQPTKRPASAKEVQVEIEQLLELLWPQTTVENLREEIGQHVRSFLEDTRAKAAKNTASPSHSKTPKTPALSLPIAKTPVPQRKTPRPDASEPLSSKTPRPATNKSVRAIQAARSKTTDDDWLKELEVLATAEPLAVLPIRRSRKPKRVRSRNLAAIVKSVLAVVATIVATSFLVSAMSHITKVDEPVATLSSPPTAIVQSPVTMPVLETRASEPPPVGKRRFVVETNVRGAKLTVAGQAIEPQSGSDGQRFGVELELGEHPVEVIWAGFQRTSTAKVDQNSSGDIHWPINFTTSEITERCRRAVCVIDTGFGHGSGFLVGDGRTLVTAAHVIEDCRKLSELQIIFNPPERIRKEGKTEERLRGVQLIAFDREADLAILRLNDAPKTATAVLDFVPAMPAVLTPVVAIGNPARLGRENSSTKNMRIVPLEICSGAVTSNQGSELQVNAPIRPGYSGGPVILPTTGEVIGVTSWKYGEDHQRGFLVDGQRARTILASWSATDEAKQTEHLAQATAKFEALSSHRLAAKTALWLIIGSKMYHKICCDVADYFVQEKRTGGNQGASLANKRIGELAEAVREGFSPMLDEEIVQLYDACQQDNNLDDELKLSLKQARAQYNLLQQDANKLKDSSVDAFQKRIDRNHKQAEKTLKQVLEKLNESLDDKIDALD